MINIIRSILRALYPPQRDDDPYPWRVGVFLWLVVLLILAGGGIAADLGGLSRFGLHSVVRANEVDAKISNAVGSMEQKIDEIGRKADNADRTSQSILKALYLPQIRAKIRERCDTSDGMERAVINKELDRINDEYTRLSGESLGIAPRCDEV